MPENNEYCWVEGDQALLELCQRISNKSWIVLDTEFIRETTYYAIPCLLQFSDGIDNWLVDPLTISDWTPLQQLLNSDLLWVMHACNEDLEVLHRLAGSTPHNLFDTQIAAQFAGMGHAISYQNLILDITDVFLEKGESRSNWMKRPLSDKQLNYATNDVHYLARCWPQLQQLLVQKQLLDYFEEDMRVISNWQVVDAKKVYLKVKMAWQIQDAKMINRLQAVCYWREQQAQNRNKPKRHILSDETLILLATENPENLSKLEHHKILYQRQIDAIGEQLLEVLRESEQSQHQYPGVRRSVEIPGSKAVLKKWKTTATEIANTNNLPPSILFTNSLLDGFFKYSVSLDSALPKMWTDWRKQLLHKTLTSILETEHLI